MNAYYGRVTTKTEGLQSVGKRNGDQYKMTAKEKKRQAADGGGEARTSDGGQKEQKMDTV